MVLMEFTNLMHFIRDAPFPGEVCHQKKTCSTPSLFGSGTDIWLKDISMSGTFFTKCFGIMVSGIESTLEI